MKEHNKPINPPHAKRSGVGTSLLVAIAIAVIGWTLISLTGANSEPNTSRDTNEDIAANIATREDVINRFAPEYCANHQSTVIHASPEGYPVNDGSGWSDEECRTIVGKLYDIDRREDRVQQTIDKKIWIGMTIEHLLFSAGQPEDVNTTVSGEHRRDQWVYPGSNYVYIENGEVTSYQT